MRKTYTVKQVAAALGFSTNTVYKYIDEGKIAATRLGKEGRFRIPESEISRLLGVKETVPAGEQLEPLIQALQNSVSTMPQVAPNPIFVKPRELAILDKIPAPSLFDWFVAVLAFFLGFSHILFPLSLQNQGFETFDSQIKFIKMGLIVFAIVLIATDVFAPKREFLHRTAHIFLGILFGGLAFFFWKLGIVISVLGYVTISVMLFSTTIFAKVKDVIRFFIFVLILALGSGILFLYNPKFFPSPTIADLISQYPYFFALIWFGLIAIACTRIFYSFSKKTSLSILPFWIIALGSFAYAFFSLGQGYWERVVYGIVLGSFTAVAPFWQRVRPFGSVSKRELFEAFSWFLAVLFIGMGLVFYLQQSFETYVLSENKKSLQNAVGIVESYVDESVQETSSFGRDAELRELFLLANKDTKTLEALAKQFYLTSSTLRYVSFFDEEGQHLAVYPYVESTALVQGREESISSQAYFQEVKEGKKPVVSDTILSETPGAQPAIYVVSPIVTSEEAFKGAVVGSIDLAKLTSKLEGVASGSDGIFVIADQNKRIILHPETNQILTSVEQNTALLDALSGKSGQKEGYNNRGELSLQSFKPIENLGWGIVAQQPLASVLSQNSRTVFMVFLVTILSGIGSLALVIYLKRPLQQVSKNL